jgi:hypothetical protein
MLLLPKINEVSSSTLHQDDTISRITRKGPQRSVGGNDEMISKFIQNLTEEKKNKLVTILNNNRSSVNVDVPELRNLNPDENNEYRFTIDTFDDRVHFSKKGATSRSPPVIQAVQDSERGLMNQHSSRDYLNQQKSVGTMDLSN